MCFFDGFRTKRLMIYKAYLKTGHRDSVKIGLPFGFKTKENKETKPILWVFYSHTSKKKLHTTQDKRDVSHPVFIERSMPMIYRYFIQAFKDAVPTMIDPLQKAPFTYSDITAEMFLDFLDPQAMPLAQVGHMGPK